jgi:hypothetical protein
LRYHKYDGFENWLFHLEGKNKRKLAKKTDKGYILNYRPHHHAARKDGFVMYHRLVWEEVHNASLLPWANVIHVNGIRDDNRPENLKAMMWHRDYRPRKLARDIPKILKLMNM